ncbi:MAG: imidazole glycerol phosphate synthase, glutamine amidotransferase subunit [Deltaproteobacteria bacterium RBG_16_71_12]|nr:MAG: imidazole glycerol phosphate synthase, glutamine amidotransferase subunit [Deltaproteobacteria bacterium RBG_16_71_12]
MITLVDYGLGNLLAFSNLYRRQNVEVTVAKSADELARATHVILPGVGSFDHAMERLDASGMRATLVALANKGTPLLGVCVGMQMLAYGSDEGSRPGLGLILGRVRAFKTTPAAQALPLPHMGWNDVAPLPGHPLFAGLDTDARFYFLHSYFFDCERTEHVAARAHYGLDFACAASAGSVFGVQFHPEKSHHWGERLLKNFAEL